MSNVNIVSKNDNISWLDKYKPTKLTDLICDKNAVQRIKSFIDLFTKSCIDKEKIMNPNILISGPNGVGKTLMVDLALKESGLEKLKVNLSSISVKKKNKKNKTKQSEKESLANNRTVESYYQTILDQKIGIIEQKKYAIVFDDISNIFAPKEKEVIKALVKLNNKNKDIPIIIISNNKHNKLVNEIKKMLTYSVKKKKPAGKKKNDKITNEIILKNPEYYRIHELIVHISKNENLKFVQGTNDDDDIYSIIIEHSQSDIRRLINILEELKILYKDKPIRIQNVNDYIETSKTKDIDPGIFEAASVLLNNYNGIEKSLLLYSEERATIPLMVHENYPLNIRTQYPKLSIAKQLDLFHEISKCLSESDKVDGLIYSNQCWNLQKVHGFYSCVLTSFYVNKLPNKLRRPESFSFTKDYNRASIKKINNKVIKKAQEHPMFKKIYVKDFLYISLILKSLMVKKDFELIADLMKPYRLKLKEIESIIKIDKIKKQEKQLTGKQKTQLKELLGVTE